MRTAFMVLLFSGCLAFSQQPTDVVSWTARGEQAFKSAHYGEAADAFQHAIDIDSSNVSATCIWAPRSSFSSSRAPTARFAKPCMLSKSIKEQRRRILWPRVRHVSTECKETLWKRGSSVSFVDSLV